MQRIPPEVVSCPCQNQDQYPSGRSAESLTLKGAILSSSKSLRSDWEHPAWQEPCLTWPWAFLISHVPAHMQG